MIHELRIEKDGVVLVELTRDGDDREMVLDPQRWVEIKKSVHTEPEKWEKALAGQAENAPDDGGQDPSGDRP